VPSRSPVAVARSSVAVARSPVAMARGPVAVASRRADTARRRARAGAAAPRRGRAGAATPRRRQADTAAQPRAPRAPEVWGPAGQVRLRASAVPAGWAARVPSGAPTEGEGLASAAPPKGEPRAQMEPAEWGPTPWAPMRPRRPRMMVGPEPARPPRAARAGVACSRPTSCRTGSIGGVPKRDIPVRPHRHGQIGRPPANRRVVGTVGRWREARARQRCFAGCSRC